MLCYYFYLSGLVFVAVDEARPVRPGMLLILTSGLCCFLTGVGLMTSSTKTANYNATKYAIGVVILVLALLAFLAVALMCVRHFKKVRQRQERLAAIITRHAYSGEEILQLSVQHMQEQIRRNAKSINKKKFLPTSTTVVCEERENVSRNKETLFSTYKQLIKTLS